MRQESLPLSLKTSKFLSQLFDQSEIAIYHLQDSIFFFGCLLTRLCFSIWEFDKKISGKRRDCSFVKGEEEMQDPAAYYQSMMAKQQHQQQQPQFPEQEQLKCPRCDSPNTKFCYYNNYNLSQPRHFCKSCRRYWTKGGALRNVPVGGGSRKNAKRSTSSSTSPSSNKKTKNPDPDPNSQNGTKPDTDPTRMLYGFPIGDQDVKGMEMGGGGSFSSLLESNMQLGLGGIMLDGSCWGDPGMCSRRSEPGNEGGGGNPWTDLAMNRVEKN